MSLAAMPLPIPTPVSYGGTGATSAAAARANLGIIYSLVTTEAELAAAFAAGDKLIAVGADITLTANQSLTGDVELKILPGYTLDLATYQLIAGAASSLSLKGPGTIAGLGGAANSIALGAGAELRTHDRLVMQWAAAASGITASELWELRDTVCQFFDGSAAAQLSGSGSIKHLLRDVELIGGGSSCGQAVDLSSRFVVSNVRVSGTFAAGLSYTFNSAGFGTITALEDVSAGAVSATVRAVKIEGYYSTVSALFVNLQGAQVHGIKLSSTATVSLSSYGMNVSDIQAGTVTLGATAVTITNLETPNAFSLNLAGCKVRGGIVLGQITVGGDRCSLIGVSTSRLDFASGGVLTITVSLGVVDTRIVGCATDAAIVDSSGTGTTVTAGNLLVT